MDFPCSGCGACCNRVERAVEAFRMIEPGYEFPYKWDNSGRCEKLEGRRCSVYEDRPLLCNIDAIIEKYGLPKGVIYELTAQACNKLIDEQNIDKKYKICRFQ